MVIAATAVDNKAQVAFSLYRGRGPRCPRGEANDRARRATRRPANGAGDVVAESGARRWAVVARSLGEQRTREGTFDAILGWALATHPGADEASLSLVGRRRRVTTVAASGDLARRSDQAQYDSGEGPCLEAIRQHRTVRVDDLGSTDAWPRFAPRAYNLGVRSMLSFHLFVDRQTLGALNLHAVVPRSFTDVDEEDGEVLAAHAAVAWDHATQERHLRDSVETRGLVGQAQGILMARYKITADDAFDLLRRASQKHNLKITDIARGVIHTGDLIDE